MTIELMTGENAQMTHMRTIASGIDTTKTTTFSWTCPDVDLNAPVVFYQFSDPSDPTNLQWVTRFTIATESGATVAAPNTDSNGVPWGIAHFTDTSLYNAIPGYLAGNGQLQGAPGNGTSTTGSTTTGSSTATSTGSTASKTGSSTMSTVTSHSSSSAPTSSTTTTSSSGAAKAFVASSSTSIMALVGAIMAGAVAVTSF
ncbi:hypothetical protein DL93DRAFT_2087101 [Clavulina sp. PMI_390]|nr:hypothetical protein DL93DRAFT_2087101 [Clavulina sp. PMI_390]